MNDYSSLTCIAIRAALQAGELLKKGFGTSFKTDNKPGRYNLVTEYDMLAENSIITTIKKEFPHHRFLAEESGDSGKEDASIMWIIDPLDGTVNFANNIPIFSVSIAAMVDKNIVSGVIYYPCMQELFIAEKGKGAYLNGVPLHVSQTTTLDKAIMATGFPYNVHENPLHCINHFSRMTRLGIPLRRLGSAAIDLAYVAAGRFDAYWEVALNPWDYAAGKLLVEEAGGKITQYDGSSHENLSRGTLLATNGHLHEELIKKLNEATECN